MDMKDKIKEIWPDENAFVADLQDHFATMTFEELAEICWKNLDILEVWRGIFSDQTYREIQTQILSIWKENKKGA